MGNIPLHPLVVHFPLVLAVLIPLLVAAILAGERWGRLTRRSWRTVPLALGFLVASGLVAQQSGSREEERVESVVRESAIETHEERAESFVWMSSAALLFGLAALTVRRERARKGLQWLTLATAVAVAGMGLRVGHSGGELVYVHGAAGAYVDRTAAASSHRSTTATADPNDYSDSDDRRKSDRERDR
jgi:uncharacterized membrane protein